MLNEKEKKAIERLKERINDNEDYKTVQVWLTADIVAVNTVLNLITKLQKENEHWKNGFERELEDNRKNTCELLKQDLIIKEKDKQIDLMAEMIDELSEYYTRYNGKNNEFCKEICIKKDIDCIDCIKQYFETKAKKGE